MGLNQKLERNPAYRHGHSRPGKMTPEYTAWQNILERCSRAGRSELKTNYSGRGITVCDRWNINRGGSFLNFLTDVGLRPAGMTGKRATYSIDRIDVNGNYEPGNVRWATAKEQAANRRKSTRIELFTDNEIISEMKKRGFICLRQLELASEQN